MPERRLAVIGGGPAGLAAAEAAATRGVAVTVFDAKRSVGRKFLIAGKSGLNLTHGEPLGTFATRYSGSADPPSPWSVLLDKTGPDDVRDWARGLGVETFQARTGRVYPVGMKAGQLLRRWVERLRSLGVAFKTQHPWTGIERGTDWRLDFAGTASAHADAVVFAMGGGSWPQTGSDGEWMGVFRQLGLPCHDLQPANCGWETDWPEAVLRAAEGLPIKNVEVRAGGHRIAGELLVTRYGLEGGAIYQLGRALRGMANPRIEIDFKPTFTTDALIGKIGHSTAAPFARAATAWNLSPAAIAMLAVHDWPDVASLARATKAFPIALKRPRPIAEAISSAGGLCWSALDPALMISTLPGCFAAGEMIDWEAPTGGYLLQGCMATGRHAGTSAAAWLMNQPA